MDDLPALILAAWQRVRPRLDDGPHDLARRLARRRRPLLTRPPRAMCLAIRASDGRLASSFGPSIHAAAIAGLPHDVSLTVADVRRVCEPVHIDWPGEPLNDV